MRRIKELEYGWIFKGAFYVSAYTVKCNNGNTYVVYAHDFNDMEHFLAKIDLVCGIAARQKDCFDHFETRKITSYIPDKNGNPKKKPFWYRGRIYELGC